MTLTDDVRHELYTATEEVIRRFLRAEDPRRMAYRGTYWYAINTARDAQRSFVHFGVSVPDGTVEVYHVDTTLKMSTRETHKPEVTMRGPLIDSYDSFWNKQIAHRHGAVVIEGVHYRIVAEPTDAMKNLERLLGHGGQEFKIRMFDTGGVITTRNLWHQGTVPPKFRNQLPDTGEFV